MGELILWFVMVSMATGVGVLWLHGRADPACPHRWSPTVVERLEIPVGDSIHTDTGSGGRYAAADLVTFVCAFCGDVMQKRVGFNHSFDVYRLPAPQVSIERADADVIAVALRDLADIAARVGILHRLADD